jgi:hypothetical protein
MSCRSERSPSRYRTSWSLKKTTGSMEGRPWGVVVLDPVANEGQIEFAFQVTVEVVWERAGQVRQQLGGRDREPSMDRAWGAPPARNTVNRIPRV